MRPITLTPAPNDSNGNPRIVAHYLNFLRQEDKDTAEDIAHRSGAFIGDNYAQALRKVKKYGGRRYHNKQYGGGIVFTSRTPEEIHEISVDCQCMVIFSPEWKEFKKTQAKVIRAICKYFAGTTCQTSNQGPVNFPLYPSREFMESIFGLPYTSTGAYAGIWCTNTQLYSNTFSGYSYDGFAVCDTTGDIYAVLTNDNEEEKKIRIN